MIEHNDTKIITVSDPVGKMADDKTKIEGLTVAFFIYNYSLGQVMNTQDYIDIQAWNLIESENFDFGNSGQYTNIAVEKCTYDDFGRIFPDLSNDLVSDFVDSSICVQNLSEIDLYGSSTDIE